MPLLLETVKRHYATMSLIAANRGKKDLATWRLGDVATIQLYPVYVGTRQLWRLTRTGDWILVSVQLSRAASN